MAHTLILILIKITHVLRVSVVHTQIHSTWFSSLTDWWLLLGVANIHFKHTIAPRPCQPEKGCRTLANKSKQNFVPYVVDEHEHEHIVL